MPQLYVEDKAKPYYRMYLPQSGGDIFLMFDQVRITEVEDQNGKYYGIWGVVRKAPGFEIKEKDNAISVERGTPIYSLVPKGKYKKYDSKEKKFAEVDQTPHEQRIVQQIEEQELTNKVFIADFSFNPKLTSFKDDFTDHGFYGIVPENIDESKQLIPIDDFVKTDKYKLLPFPDIAKSTSSGGRSSGQNESSKLSDKLNFVLSQIATFDYVIEQTSYNEKGIVLWADLFTKDIPELNLPIKGIPSLISWIDSLPTANQKTLEKSLDVLLRML